MSRDNELAGLGALDTEAVRPELAELDVLDVPDLVALMTSESTRACDAVVAATSQIAGAVAGVAQRLAEGGRLIYVGAGTAGRLGVLDAAEAGPTFDVPDGLVLAVFAGGSDAMTHVPAKEPRMTARLARSSSARLAARLEMRWSGSRRAVGPRSSSARSTTPAPWGHSLSGSSATARSAVADAAELPIELLVGGEVIAGSTRLNAGTAQKITLNILSTAVMIQLGKTYGNLMVDVRATNEKLRDRATRIVATVAKTSPERARMALEACGWRTKPACLVAASTMDAEHAAELLAASGGRLASRSRRPTQATARL